MRVVHSTYTSGPSRRESPTNPNPQPTTQNFHTSGVAIQHSSAGTMRDNDNPWESAVDNPSWSQANFSMDQKEDVEESAERNPGQGDLAARIVRYVVNLWHFSDVSVGFAILIYGIILHKEGKEPKSLIGTSLALGAVLMLRALLGSYSTYKDNCQRVGVLVSAYLSSVMSVVFFTASMISLEKRQDIAAYFRAHQAGLHLQESFITLVENHVHFVWVTLLVGCGIEALRSISLVSYRNYLLDEDELSLQLLPQSSRRNRKPWWWSARRGAESHPEELVDPLLGPTWATANNRSYQMDHGLDSGSIPSIWSRIFGGTRARNNSSARDDGSVDFASVQEDWASRTEEDPLWWTRDEGESNNGSS